MSPQQKSHHNIFITGTNILISICTASYNRRIPDTTRYLMVDTICGRLPYVSVRLLRLYRLYHDFLALLKSITLTNAMISITVSNLLLAKFVLYRLPDLPILTNLRFNTCKKHNKTVIDRFNRSNLDI